MKQKNESVAKSTKAPAPKKVNLKAAVTKSSAVRLSMGLPDNHNETLLVQ